MSYPFDQQNSVSRYLSFLLTTSSQSLNPDASMYDLGESVLKEELHVEGCSNGDRIGVHMCKELGAKH
jgi:hypothetical protein